MALKSFLHITSYKSQTSSPVKVLQNNLLVILIKRLNSMLWYFSLHRPTIILNNLLELLPLFSRLTLAEYHEQEEIFKLRLGHLKKVSIMRKSIWRHVIFSLHVVLKLFGSWGKFNSFMYLLVSCHHFL